MKKFTEKVLKKFDKLDKESSKRLLESSIEYNNMLENIINNIERGIILIKDNEILFSNNHIPSLIKVNSKANDIYSFFLDSDIHSFIYYSLKKRDMSQKDFTYSIGNKYKIISILVNKLSDDKSRIIEIKDVTKIREDAVVQRRNEQLASFTTMAAAVAHEIKNPLTSMLLYIQLLEKKLEKEKCLDKKNADKYLSVLTNEVDRLNTIVVDFLFAVRPVNCKFEKTNVNKLLSNIVEFVRKEASDNNCKITTKFEPYLPKIDLDEGLIRQAILNIIKNAINANDKKNGNILITTNLDKDKLEVEIADNGHGMNEKTLDKIFEPYFTTKDNGSGLGLTVVYKIVKEHNGEIFVQSKKNKGTKFTLVFPISSNYLKQLEYREE